MTRKRHTVQSVDIEQQGLLLTVLWSDNSQSRYHAIWLRANAQGTASVDSTTGQRLTSTPQIPADSQIQVASADQHGGLRVIFGADEFECHFSADWLRRHQYDRMPTMPQGWTDPTRTLWDSSLESPSAIYEDIMNDNQALAQWLRTLNRLGFARLTDCPRESGAVIRIGERIGFIRETNYGRHFDVKSTDNPINLAYTGQSLEVHTDNPYRDPVPGLQLLLAIRNDNPDGESVIVDGFAAAVSLRNDDPEAFKLLCEHSVPFSFKAAGINLSSEAPIISLTVDGEIKQIRHNNRAIQPTRLPFDITASWYEAFLKFAGYINDSRAQLRFTLAAGDFFVVDNYRVLHGRSEYDPSKGDRHLQGCYVEKDMLSSRIGMA